MLSDFMKHFNWVDIITLIFLIRGIYRGAKNGFVFEFLSLIAWLVAVFFSFKFYRPIAAVIHQRTDVPVAIDELIVFAGIIFVVIIIARIAAGVFGHIIKIKLFERLNRLGGIVSGLAKSVLVLSLVFYALGIVHLPYLSTAIREKSLSGRTIARISEVIYSNIEQIAE